MTRGDDKAVSALPEFLHERVVRVDDELATQRREAVTLHRVYYGLHVIRWGGVDCSRSWCGVDSRVDSRCIQGRFESEADGSDWTRLPSAMSNSEERWWK
jgi:hypothetical protein